MEPVWVLHRWPWQEHGLLLELFTRSSGRVRVIAKGAKRSKSPWRSALQPFVLCQAAWVGRSDLKTLTQAEPEMLLQLTGHHLYSGFYINELLQRMLPSDTELPELFDDYTKTLQLLAENTALEPVLRRFEWQLLQRLELDFSWTEEAQGGAAISPAKSYDFVPEHGFIPCGTINQSALTLTGGDIQALAAFDLQSRERLQQFKQIMRLALAPHLGNKPLQSRQLFSGYTTSAPSLEQEND